jgi:hypothetical protein
MRGHCLLVLGILGCHFRWLRELTGRWPCIVVRDGQDSCRSDCRRFLSDLGAEKRSPGSWEGLPTLSVTCYLWLSDRQLSSSDTTGETEVTKLS